MPGPEFESEPIFTQGGNSNAYENYLERSARSAQSAVLSAEFHLKTTSGFNIIKRIILKNQVASARKRLHQNSLALADIQLQEAVNQANAELNELS